MKVRKMKKGENIYEYLQYCRWAENAKRYFYPHLLYVAFRYDHGNHYFVKFDWDMWGEAFYQKGWFPIDSDTKFEIQDEEYLKKDGTKAEQILNILNEISPLKITSKQLPFVLAMIQQVFQDGAEFGYNKANEWHDLRKNPNDLPKATTTVLVILESGVPYVSWISSDKGWWFCTNYYTGEDKVIAWKEIILPKEIE